MIDIEITTSEKHPKVLFSLEGNNFEVTIYSQSLIVLRVRGPKAKHFGPLCQFTHVNTLMSWLRERLLIILRAQEVEIIEKTLVEKIQYAQKQTQT